MSEFWCVTHVIFTTSKRLPVIFFGVETHEVKPENAFYEERTRTVTVDWFETEKAARQHEKALYGQRVILERKKRLYVR